MKLSEFYMTTQSALDAFTIKHLADWCERHRPSAEPAGKVCARMVRYLEALDPQDREHLIGRGWTVVFDSMEASK